MPALAEAEPRPSSSLPLAAIPSPVSVTWPRPGYGNRAFTGREWDSETGLYYYRARYYDPKAGRFISDDPIGFAGGPNLRSYVKNNPATMTDPLGLAPRFWVCYTKCVEDLNAFPVSFVSGVSTGAAAMSKALAPVCGPVATATGVYTAGSLGACVLKCTQDEIDEERRKYCTQTPGAASCPEPNP